MTTISITYDDTEVKAALGALLGKVQNPSPAFREIGEVLVQSTRQRFVDSRAPDGRPWQQNSDVTLMRVIGEKGLSKRKTKTGGRTLTKPGVQRLANKKPLVWHGHLRDSIRYQVVSDGVVVGTNREYAAVQQFGARMGEFGRYYQLFRQQYGEKDFRRYAGMRKGHPIPWGNIPARPFLGVSTQDKVMILDILRDYLIQS